MLRRAIASVLAQTYTHIVVKVVNDDPNDEAVEDIVRETQDDRVSMFAPVVRRGPTRNFNLVFDERDADYVSLLEDDNWWEPGFLEQQLFALEGAPDCLLVVANEQLWQELDDGGWLNTKLTIWPFADIRRHKFSVEEIGSAKICNSAMLVRVRREHPLQTPEIIPVDVTEHFRERLLPPLVLLNGVPLVNYAMTLQTARNTCGDSWGDHQCLLIGSVFVAADPGDGKALAARLWRNCVGKTSQRAVSLISTSIAFPEARALLWAAPTMSLCRFGLWLIRRPVRLIRLLTVRRRLAKELDFLVAAPLTQYLARQLG